MYCHNIDKELNMLLFFLSVAVKVNPLLDIFIYSS